MTKLTPLDALAIAAHPDDVELSAGGTLIKLARMGYRTGIVDMARGEVGTRGTPDKRAKEAANAAKAMGLVDELVPERMLKRPPCILLKKNRKPNHWALSKRF